ncbi:hypothetical protein ACWDWO_07035 [Actinopolymorpha singaporensis]|uniref:PRC-barrel domain-containing protein n=1 Tax=Actinopolymorpha singaporensis TaxID=117157 RepID=A0A1H1RA38_9ACTN|nr:hypothetical protein [Actinopolymorpha singaporensis]SDS32535.1 hypothetical protein SAMN04489717_2336 [Actinopolymorpha singaporensis]
MTTPLSGNEGPITQVREGMPVVDAEGKKLGKVAELKMGDPEAATEQGQQAPSPGGGGVVSNVLAAFDNREPFAVPTAGAADLLRTGFVKVDPSGLFKRDFYVSAADVLGVQDGTVRVSISAAQLAD